MFKRLLTLPAAILLLPISNQCSTDQFIDSQDVPAAFLPLRQTLRKSNVVGVKTGLLELLEKDVPEFDYWISRSLQNHCYDFHTALAGKTNRDVDVKNPLQKPRPAHPPGF